MRKHTLQNGFAAAPLFIAIFAIVAVVGGIAYFSTRDDETAGHGGKSAEMEKDEMMEGEESVMMNGEDGAMMEEHGGDMMQEKSMMKRSGALLAGTSAPLLDFTKTGYEAALKTDKLVVLYFYANWCPVCKAEFPLMQGAFDELTTDAVIGFRVNYNDDDTDTDEKALAKEFGVAYQHTKVFVKNGARVLKSPEGWDKNRYLNEIKKFADL